METLCAEGSRETEFWPAKRLLLLGSVRAGEEDGACPCRKGSDGKGEALLTAGEPGRRLGVPHWWGKQCQDL